jgi:hypothetical protein
VTWVVVGGPIGHAEPGVDGRGWLWEIKRCDDYRRVFVEVSGTALAAGGGIAEDTVRAIATEGGSVVDALLDQDDPPRVVKCSTHGCRSADPD